MEAYPIWFWLLLLVYGVICGIIGYYLGKGKGAATDLSKELLELKNNNARLQNDLDACSKQLASTAATTDHARVAPEENTPSLSESTASKYRSVGESIIFP